MRYASLRLAANQNYFRLHAMSINSTAVMCVVARLLLNLEGNEGYGHDWYDFYGVVRMGTERKFCRICRENTALVCAGHLTSGVTHVMH